jgi:squalene-hopene/tetraprenyl-beta-curcumene cyclase
MTHPSTNTPLLRRAGLQAPPVDVVAAMSAAAESMLRQQHREGWWCGELEADSSLEADAIMMDFYLGEPNLERVRKMANCIREEQTAEGGWCMYPGGQPNINLIIKSYFALRLAGVPENDPALVKARKLALDLGGVEAANSFTRIYLCFFGQYSWNDVPALPPEILLLPNFAYINLYEVSAWSRAILVPLSIIYSFQPKKKPPHGVSLKPLFLEQDTRRTSLFLPGEPLHSWKSIIHAADRTLSVLEQKKWTPLRKKALKKAEQWLVEHLENSDGLGAIYPAMMNAIIAMDCLGYDRNSGPLRHELDEFWKLGIEEGETFRMQPCVSPVWDTALAAFATNECMRAAEGAEAQHEALQRGADWLISKQVLRTGDWAVKNPAVAPGGWCFEFANDPYPDVDDTAMVLLALSRIRTHDTIRQQQSMRRGLAWLLSMQNADGGWSSFDKDNNKQVLTQVPYADHNAMLDPSAADITGRVLEMLGSLGYGPTFPPAERAIDYLRRQQESEGCWFGRWGVNYIYGTCFALRGLAAIGYDMTEGTCMQAAEWIRSLQNADGGWGETADSYHRPELRGIGPSTAAQTAWALMAIFSTGDYYSESAVRGVKYLLDHQRDGGWEDVTWTGTGFPKVFYLKYHLYSHYFPMLALAEYHRHHAGTGAQSFRGLPDWQRPLDRGRG